MYVDTRFGHSPHSLVVMVLLLALTCVVFIYSFIYLGGEIVPVPACNFCVMQLSATYTEYIYIFFTQLSIYPQLKKQWNDQYSCRHRSEDTCWESWWWWYRVFASNNNTGAQAWIFIKWFSLTPDGRMANINVFVVTCVLCFSESITFGLIIQERDNTMWQLYCRNSVVVPSCSFLTVCVYFATV